MKDCDATLTDLRTVVNGVLAEKKTFAGQAVRQFKLGLERENVTSIRSRIQTQNDGLQIVLLVVNM